MASGKTFLRKSLRWVGLFIVLPAQVSWAAGLAEHVIIISIDGGKPQTILSSVMPNLKAVVGGGSSTWSAQTIVPSKTLPSHVSMLTGVGPEIHQIIWNEWMPQYGAVRVPTVFGLARANGLSTALFAAKEKFRHLEVPGTLNYFSFTNADSMSIAEAASQYLVSKRPNLLFIHFPDADQAGHQYGWDSPVQKQALQYVDSAIGRVFRALQSTDLGAKTVVIITGDHGGNLMNHGGLSAADRLIPWIVFGKAVRVGTSISKQVHTVDTAATALWVLGVPWPATWQGKPVHEAFEAAGNIRRR